MNDQPTPTEKAREIAEKKEIPFAPKELIDYSDPKAVASWVVCKWQTTTGAYVNELFLQTLRNIIADDLTAALTRSEEEKNNAIATVSQPIPNGNGADIGKLVVGDIEARLAKGEATYGERLKAHNGRCSITDAYQEVLDLALYLRQHIEEQSELSTLTARLKEAEKALRFIAEQGCEGDTGDYAQCKELPGNLCVTEYCLPCYASSFLTASTPVEKE